MQVKAMADGSVVNIQNVNAIGRSNRSYDNEKLNKEEYNIYLVGDAKEPNRIFEATQSGAEAAISIGNPHKTYSHLYK